MAALTGRLQPHLHHAISRAHSQSPLTPASPRNVMLKYRAGLAVLPIPAASGAGVLFGAVRVFADQPPASGRARA
jgi:hypothetical protein